MSSWGSGLSIWIEIVCGSRDFYFRAIQNQDRSGRMWDLESFYYLIQHQIVLKLLECHPGVVDCQSELKLVLWKQGLLFLEPFKIKAGQVECEIWRALLFNTSDCLETTWVSSGVVDCQSELKLFCGNRDFFLEPFKSQTDQVECDFGAFIMELNIRLFWNCWVTSWGSGLQSELKLFCGNRDFPFESHPKSQTEDVEYEIWRAFII